VIGRFGSTGAVHALPQEDRAADRDDARDRLEPGDQAHPHQALDDIVLRH